VDLLLVFDFKTDFRDITGPCFPLQDEAGLRPHESTGGGGAQKATQAPEVAQSLVGQAGLEVLLQGKDLGAGVVLRLIPGTVDDAYQFCSSFRRRPHFAPHFTRSTT
jgi:hypothetical protein